MGKLIAFEFRKVLRSKYFYILLGIAVGFSLLTTVIFIVFEDILKQAGETVLPYSAYLNAKSALASSFTVIGAIFVAIFACEDYSLGTLKTIVAKGYNRLQLFYSKYIVSLVMLFGIALADILFNLLLGLIIWGDGGLVIDDNVALIILGQFLSIIAIHAVYFFVSYSIGKMGASIAITILAPTGITLILTLVETVVNKDSFLPSLFWIDGILANFTATVTNYDYVTLGLILLVVYALVANGLGILIARKKQF